MRAGFVDMHHLLPLKHYNPYRITNQRWQPPSFSSSIGKPAAVTTSLKSVCWDFRRHVMTKLISRRNKASIGKRTALKLCINKLLCDVHSLKFKTGNRDIGYNHTNVENRGESKLPVHLRCFRCCGHHLYDFSSDTIHLTSKHQTITISWIFNERQLRPIPDFGDDVSFLEHCPQHHYFT